MAGGDDITDGYGDEEENIVFHHKKGEFRRLEDEKTQDLAQGGGFKSKGFFGVLVGTKGNRMIFAALLVCVGLFFVFSFLAGRKNEDVIGGVACKMDAFSIEETVYVSVALSMASGSKQSEDSDFPKHFYAVVNAFDADGANVASSWADCLFSPPAEKEGTRFLRTTFTDYDVASVECTVFLGGNSETKGEWDASDAEDSVLLTCKVAKH